MPEQEPFPRGLVLFPPGTPPRLRRRKLALTGVIAAAGAALLWPIYPLFSGIRPLILGLPLSLAWVVLWLGVVFGALIGLYRAEYGRRGESRLEPAAPTADAGRREG